MHIRSDDCPYDDIYETQVTCCLPSESFQNYINPISTNPQVPDSNLATTAVATTSSSNPDNDQIAADLPTTYGQIFANTPGEAYDSPTNGGFSISSDLWDINQQTSSESV